MSKFLHQHLDIRLALALFMFFTGFYALTARAHFSIADEETFFHVTEGLVERGTFVQLPESQTGPVPRSLASGRDEALYAVTGPVQSVLAVPFYLVGRFVGRLFPTPFRAYFTRFFVALFNAPIGALTVACLYMLARELNYTRRTALFTALTLGLGSVIWPYARTFFAESLLAFWLLLATWAVIRYVRTAQPGWLLLWSTAFGLGVLTKYVMVITFPFFCLYLLWTFLHLPDREQGTWGRRTLSAALIPLVALALLGALFNYARFGNFLETGYTQEESRGAFSDWGEEAKPLIAWYGYLFSSGEGYFFFSPPAVLFLLGLGNFYRHRRRVTWLLLSLILVYPLFYSIITHRWHGGGNWGPRYIVCVTPFVILVGGAFLERRDLSRWVRIAVPTSLLILGILVQLSFLFVNYATYLFSDVPAVQQLYNPARSQLRAQWLLWPRQLRRWLEYDHVKVQGREVFVLEEGFYEVEVPTLAPFGRWSGAEAEIFVYVHPQENVTFFLEYSTPDAVRPIFTYDGIRLTGDYELVHQGVDNYQWHEHLMIPASMVQILPGTLRLSMPDGGAGVPEDERELGVFLADMKVIRDGEEIFPSDVHLPEPLPLVPDYPWSWEAMFWFYNPQNARPLDVWPAYVWTSGLPRRKAVGFILVLGLFFFGISLKGVVWLGRLVSENL